MSKFKVGDIIRCVKYKDEIVNEGLRKAEIIDNTPYFKIKILEHDEPMRVNYRVECIFVNLNFDDYFEYFDEEKEPDLTGLHPMTPDEMQRVLEKFEYIDDTMDTSNRPVVDLSDHAVDSLYPNIINTETWKNLYDKYVNGIWEIEEEKDMNKVLKVWYERKRDKVIDEYEEKEVEFYNNRYSVVESFNALVEQFNEDLESLYKMDKVTEQFVLKENTSNNVIKYCLDLDKLKEEFEVEYLIKRNEELKEIEDIREEVEAQLSLSDDLKYQQEVLERYGIINKKTKKIVG